MAAIMVLMADKTWTAQAAHMASAIARNRSADLHLLRMVPAQHLGWLGTELGDTAFTSQEYAAFMEYRQTAEDYGVNVCLAQMQCHTLHDAIADAAEHLDADVVFATLPEMKFRPWRKFLLWQLKRRLQKQQRQLFTLEPATGAEEWTPSVTVPASREKKETTHPVP